MLRRRDEERSDAQKLESAKAELIVNPEKKKTMFKNKTLLFTGATCSFGHAVLKQFHETDIAKIRIFSRDEKIQDVRRHHYTNCIENLGDADMVMVMWASELLDPDKQDTLFERV